MSYSPQSSHPGAFPPPPPLPQPTKSSKWLWIILGIVIGVPTILMGGCVACFAILGVAGSRQTSGSYSVTSPSSTGGSSSSSAAPAAAPSSRITLSAFNRISDGMTYAQVVNILGKEGTEISSSNLAGYKTVMYQWDGDSWGANMNAMFQNGRLISKSQFGLK